MPIAAFHDGGGRGGQLEQARLEIEIELQCKVYLRLTVHVDEDWTKNEARVRHYGLGNLEG